MIHPIHGGTIERIRTLFKVYNIDDPTKGYLVPQTEGLICTAKSMKHTLFG